MQHDTSRNNEILFIYFSTQIMVILFMTNQTMIHFSVKQKALNIMQHQLLLVLYEEYRKLKYTANQGQIHLDQGNDLQKQPFRGVLRKRCSENMEQIYRRTPMPKCDFNKTALQFCCHHTSAQVFSCKFVVYFLRTPFPKNTSGGLLLGVDISVHYKIKTYI